MSNNSYTDVKTYSDIINYINDYITDAVIEETVSEILTRDSFVDDLVEKVKEQYNSIPILTAELTSSNSYYYDELDLKDDNIYAKYINSTTRTFKQTRVYYDQGGNKKRVDETTVYDPDTTYYLRKKNGHKKKMTLSVKNLLKDSTKSYYIKIYKCVGRRSKRLQWVPASPCTSYNTLVGQKFGNTSTQYPGSNKLDWLDGEDGIFQDTYDLNSSNQTFINLNDILLTAIKPSYIQNDPEYKYSNNAEVRFIGQRNKSAAINRNTFSGNLTFKFVLVETNPPNENNSSIEKIICECPSLLKIGPKNNKKAKALTANSIKYGNYYCTLK